MKLCVAEKPSVARELARVLNANTKREGYFEGNGYLVSWTFGHFCTLKTPEDYDRKLRSWDINWLPIIPHTFGIKLIENEGAVKQFKILESLINRSDCDEIINCGDAGQEGELIQRWVYQKAGNKKPVKRLWISSLTESAIREGFGNLKNSSEYDRLYFAGSARAIGDWLLGINASRLYTVKYGTGKTVLSIGRVQTPTLAMIVNRYLEIENFSSEAFWEVKTSYREVLFSYDGGRFTEKEKAEALFNDIQNELFEITDFSKNPGKEFAPKLFDLTSLQVDCNKKLNLSADDTLQIVQGLYERKLITYPRVDTSYLPEEMFSKINEILKQLKPFEKEIAPIFEKGIIKTKRVFDDAKITDHHAIIPTGIQANILNDREKAVYETIVYRFLANFYPDCEVSNTKVQGRVNAYFFNATGKEILIPGWRTLYQQNDDEEKEEEKQQTIPTFKLGESGVHLAQIQEKNTQAPKLFTEATLLRAMETAGKQVEDESIRETLKANGIGRPSTRANIIETLFKRNYVVRKKKSLLPTQIGIELIQTIEYELLKSPELTGKWEQKLNLIEKGKYDLSLFINEMKEMVSQLVQDVKYKTVGKSIGIEVVSETISSAKNPKKRINKSKTKNDILKCPKCQIGIILKGKTAYGCSEWKTGCNFRIPFEELQKRFQTTELSSELLARWKES